MAQLAAKTQKRLKAALIVLLVLFSTVSVIFSLVVLFTDLNPKRAVSTAQSSGLFTVFIYDYLNEIHPIRLPAGKFWTVKSIEFPNEHSAIVESTDGQTRSRLEFIYAIEYPSSVRVLKINDLTGRDIQDAQLALIRYLDFLRNADYENAAALYGGPLSTLVPYGPADAKLPELFAGYCSRVSPAHECLSFTIREPQKDEVTGKYYFVVSYALPDNTGFVSPSGKENFVAEVVQNESGVFEVTTLPFE